MANYKLLLADDSITIQKVVNLTFADEGIEVISVGDGSSALEKFSEFTPDLVMADINMPGLSGYEICERIKQNEQTRHIPVILLVGSFEPFDETEAERVGADDYLTKPFQSIRQLVNKVSILLAAGDGKDQKTSPDEHQTISDADIGSEIESPQAVSEESLQVQQTASAEELGDAGMDDEMIQTNQAGGLADSGETQSSNFKDEFDEDYNKTQPLSAEDLTHIGAYSAASFDSAEDFRSDEYETGEFSPPPQDSTGEIYAENIREEQVNSPFGFDLELDDMNLLELPPRESSFSPNIDSTAQQKEETGAEAREGVQESPGGEIKTSRSVGSGGEEAAENKEYTPSVVINDTVSEELSSGAFQAGSLSQEDIDAIARKVAEKLSDKVIEELAPQITDLLVKRMTEEKLKE